MATISNPVWRLAVAGGFALAIAAAPALAVLATPSTGSVPAVAACPPGEHLDVATDTCVPGADTGIGTENPNAGHNLPEVAGIPCTGANTGQCIGLEESQPVPVVEPRTSISSSP